MALHDDGFTKRLKLGSGRLGRAIRPALCGGHQLSAVAVCSGIAAQTALHKRTDAQEIEVPTKMADRRRFLRNWAAKQRRRAIESGAWSLLVLPLFAVAANAQGTDQTDLATLEGVSGTEIMPDGSLSIFFEDGSVVVVPEGQYIITADGQLLVQVDALAEVGAAGAGSGALAAIGGLVAAGVAAGAAGGSGDSASTASGFVIDGYISGATVFRDEDGDGVFDDGEAFTTTDDQGAFSGLGGSEDAPIVSTGGIDISTGLVFEGSLKAPAGSTVISPVTTLVQQIVEADQSGETSVEDAVAQVNSALGLEEDTDLLNEDPIASENNDLFAAGAKVVNIVNVGVAAGADEGEIIQALAEAIATAEAGDEPLNDGEEIQDVLEAALGGEPSSSDIDAVSNTIANANNAIDDSAEEGDTDAIADVQQIVQTEISEEVESGELDEAKTQEEVEQDAENALDVVDGQVNFDDALIEEHTDLSEFGLEINFGASVYEVIEGVEFKLDMSQVDSLQITGAGVVKLVGEFDPGVDLSGISAPIDATDVDGFELSLTTDQADGLVIDVAADATLTVNVDFADLSAENPSLTPEIDLSGITVNGSSSPAALFNVLDAGSVEETFKLLWNQADNNYYDALPGGTPAINAANIELGNLYAQYLLDGGEPLLDVVQTKVSGNPDFEVRQQSLHDNLLGNIKDSVVESRINSNALDADNRDAAGLQFGDRPIYDGRLSNADDLLATQIWDIANGYARSDFTVSDGTVYVLNGDTVVDADSDLDGIQAFTDLSDALAAAAEGAYVVVGGGTYTENESVYVNGSITVFAEDGAILEGGLRVESGSTESVVNISGLDIDVTGTSYGIYLNGTDLTLNVTDVDIDGGGSPTSRGIITQSQTDPIINVSGGSLTNLQSGVYLNPGSTLNVDGTEFTGNTAAIGTDEPAALNVVNSIFDGNDEAIGISGDHNNSNVTLAGNQYVQETDQVLVYFAREDGEAAPVAIPGAWSNVTIVQSSDPDNNKAQLTNINGTAGDDVIVDNAISTEIDLSAGGSDFVILTADHSAEGLNQILGFTAGSADGADQLAFNYENGGQLRGSDFEVLFDGDPLGVNTGFATFADVNLTSTADQVLQSGLQEADISAILGAVDPLVDGEDDSILVAVSSVEDTLVFSVDLDETAPDADRVISLAVLENTATDSLTADNLYDFSAVTANT